MTYGRAAPSTGGETVFYYEGGDYFYNPLTGEESRGKATETGKRS